MDHNIVSALSIGECWLLCIKKIIRKGNLHNDENIKIREILGLTVSIATPQLYDDTVYKFGDKTVIDRTLAKFAKDANMPDRPFTYGARIYDYCGIDQFEWLIQRLSAKKETKSATISLLIPGSESPNLPCLTTIDVKIRDKKLELQFFFRSQNIFGRQYANFLALAKLQSDIANRCSVNVGQLKGYIASAHIYEYDFAEAELIASNKQLKIHDKYYTEGPTSIRIV